jgi:uncharacterized protein YcgI (DUF1989 family)
VNVFMNIPVGTEGDLSWLPAVSRPGDAVTFAAAMDCAVVLSACPMDLNAINGQRPTSLAVDIMSPNPALPKGFDHVNFTDSALAPPTIGVAGNPIGR